MSAREILALVRESSFGTPVETPENGVDRHYMRLSADDSFKGLMKPVVEDVQSGGGFVMPACPTGDSFVYEGSIQGELVPAQSAFLLGWATTRINDDRDEPWETTDPLRVMGPGHLASISAYHGVQELDGTYARRRGSGLKARTFTASASATSRIWRWNAGFVGIRDDTNAAGAVAAPDATEFPAPAAADMPCNPWLFSHTSGGLKIGSTRSMYDSLSLNVQNTLVPFASESPYPQAIWFSGRVVTLQVAMLRKPSATDLAAFRALTALDVELTLFNGTNTLKLDFNGAVRWSDFDQQLPVGSPYKWAGTLKSYIDPAAAGSDFSFTYS
jgi:hypothetical protein